MFGLTRFASVLYLSVTSPNTRFSLFSVLFSPAPPSPLRQSVLFAVRKHQTDRRFLTPVVPRGAAGARERVRAEPQARQDLPGVGDGGGVTLVLGEGRDGYPGEVLDLEQRRHVD